MRIDHKIDRVQSLKLRITSKVERLQSILSNHLAKAIAQNRIPLDETEEFTHFFLDKIVDFR